MTATDYNTRLFSGGLRKYIHTGRFRWLTRSLTNLRCQYASVLELGCFDGKALAYLPVKPARYLGLDANWEGGLDLAREQWQDEPNFTFRACQRPEDMQLNGEKFDLTLCLETLEHLAPALMEAYLAQLAQATRQYLLISVPNEKGLVFLGKYLAKKFLADDGYAYTIREIVQATCGRLDRIARNEHKGFDYVTVIKSVARYCEVAAVTGYPFAGLPAAWNFGVGIIGKV